MNRVKFIRLSGIDGSDVIITSEISSYYIQTRSIDAYNGNSHGFGVLILNRCTTSGLLVHDQNDVGIIGSLPSHVNRLLL